MRHRGPKTAPLFVAIILAASCMAEAQPRGADSKGVGGIGMLAALPQGEMRDLAGPAMLGISGAFGGQVPRKPVLLTTEIGLMTYGLDEELVLQPASRDGGSFRARPSVTSAYSAESNNHLLTGHFIARLQPEWTRIRPHVEGLVGVQYFFSRTVVESQLITADRRWLVRPGERRIQARANFDDLGLSYGIGTGLAFPVYHGPLGASRSTADILVSLTVRYMRGGEAHVLSSTPIVSDNGRVTFESGKARVELIVPRVELRFFL